MAKSTLQKGLDVGADAALIGVGQVATSELIDLIQQEFQLGEGEAVALLVQAGLPIAAGAAVAGTSKNEYARNVAIGAMATGGVNLAKWGISKVRSIMEANTQSSTKGIRRSIAASRRLPPARREEKESGMLAGASAQYATV